MDTTTKALITWTLALGLAACSALSAHADSEWSGYDYDACVDQATVEDTNACLKAIGESADLPPVTSFCVSITVRNSPAMQCLDFQTGENWIEPVYSPESAEWERIVRQ